MLKQFAEGFPISIYAVTALAGFCLFFFTAGMVMFLLLASLPSWLSLMLLAWVVYSFYKVYEENKND